MSSLRENNFDSLAVPRPTPGERHYEKFTVSPELEAEAQRVIALYPEGKAQSAILPLLHEVQTRFGYICADSIIWVAEKTGSTPAHVLGVVTFYPGLRQSCPGRFHIRVCRTLACSMAGSEELFDILCEKTGIDRTRIDHDHPIGVSADGLWSIEFVECLAQCGFGPSVMVNDDVHQCVTPDKADELLAQYSDQSNPGQTI